MRDQGADAGACVGGGGFTQHTRTHTHGYNAVACSPGGVW